MKWKSILVVTAGTIALRTVPSFAQAVPTAQLTAASSPQFGAYLADDSGRALYIYSGDSPYVGDYPAESYCTDACAKAWPPFIARQKPKAGSQIDPAAIGTVPRQDGTIQITYEGW